MEKSAFIHFSFIKSPQFKNIFIKKKNYWRWETFSLCLDNTVDSLIVKHVLVYRSFFTPPVSMHVTRVGFSERTRGRCRETRRFTKCIKAARILGPKFAIKLLYGRYWIPTCRCIRADKVECIRILSMHCYTDEIQSEWLGSYLLSGQIQRWNLGRNHSEHVIQISDFTMQPTGEFDAVV